MSAGRTMNVAAGHIGSHGGEQWFFASRALIVLLAVMLFAIPVLLMPVRSMAETHSGYLVDHGIAVYYAIIPAEMIAGHPKQHPEGAMHGGVPNRSHAHHVMVALFDASGLERIVNAVVTVTISEIGLVGEQKKLEPITVAGALTYGIYFDLRLRTDYRIRVDIKGPGSPNAARVEFGFKHE